SLAAFVPFPWVYAFYQNATVLDDGQDASIMALVRRSLRQTRLWPRQNFVVLWLTCPYLLIWVVVLWQALLPAATGATGEWSHFIFYLYAAILSILLLVLNPFPVAVAMNLAVLIYFIPSVIEMLLGVETELARSMGFSSTMIAAIVCALTYLCLDPLLKAAYVLRCFYGESLESGADLRADLRMLIARSSKAAMLLAVWAAFFCANGPAHAQEIATEDTARVATEDTARISTEQLDSSIAEVVKRREFSWRMPRELQSQDIQENFVMRNANRLREWSSERLDRVRKILRRVQEWITRKAVQSGGGGESSGAWVRAVPVLIYVLLGVLIVALLLLVWRMWRVRSRRVDGEIAPLGDAPPDLEDEQLRADDLPEDRWLELAGELREKGEYRLALRATFLAVLAHLGRNELISIARFKSNRDYGRELQRRAHHLPEVLQAFGGLVGIYERTWYGPYPATMETLRKIDSEQQRIRGNESN
ncbi:MAG: DUF4129 domain-containing protein, partial [Candidatus Hydrogenedentes bacterium]|nr:DUF4129 domain-containing protein [Candidatus Hydrogenedentota bacterium]